MLKTNERICKICKGIINLNNHDYYYWKNIKRNIYFCKSCLEYKYKDNPDMLSFYEKIEYIL